MRKTFREQRSPDYWASRWDSIPADAPAQGHDRYPLLYSDMAVGHPPGEVLELGCGAGRLVRHYHMKGVQIVGVDNVKAAIRKLRECDPTLNVMHADARNLPFDTGRFSTVLCFGVYHSLEDDVPAAVQETFRVLKPGGRLCAEFRADTLHNRLIDRYKQGRRPAVAFHKWNYLRHEARDLLANAGFVIEQVLPAINMPLLYHVAALRHPTQRHNDEHEARTSGYRLRPWLDALHAAGANALPYIFANEYIILCRKPPH